MSFLSEIHKRGVVIAPPKFLFDNTHYEVIMGSVAYGVSNDDSDMDIYGWCIPPKEDIFPHLVGEIPGFGRQKQRFEQYVQHHIKDDEKNREYDITIYGIVKYFSLVMENNPNMIDSLFVPQHCVLSCTPAAQMVRDNRELFLHKGTYHKFRGYAHSQLAKIDSKSFEGSEKRRAEVSEYGYSVKFAYHVVRFLDEAEQILQEGTLDLLKSKEVLKSIRRGEWKLQQIKDYFTEKEVYLKKLYEESRLPYSPDEGRIKQLLIDCLETHYGSLSAAIVNPDRFQVAFGRIAEIVDSIR